MKRMVLQELPMSCGPACALQLLLEVGIRTSEGEIRKLAGFHPILGTTVDGLRTALERLHPNSRYISGSVMPEDLDALARNVPFIARLRRPSPHFVIVDQVESNRIWLRDPGGDPAVLTVSREIFLVEWTAGLNSVVFRIA